LTIQLLHFSKLLSISFHSEERPITLCLPTDETKKQDILSCASGEDPDASGFGHGWCLGKRSTR